MEVCATSKMFEFCSYCAPCTCYGGVCYKGNVRVILLMFTLYLLWKCVLQGKCSSYVVNVHRILAMEVCATGEMFELCT
jgi:hypothetical protein